MTDMTGNTGNTAQVEADPKKPWKAVAGAIVTLLGLFWAALAGRDDMGDMNAMEWAAIIIPTILTFAAVYGVKNPKVLETNRY